MTNEKELIDFGERIIVEAMKDDERMLLCARTCRDCANHCREMSKLPI